MKRLILSVAALFFLAGCALTDGGSAARPEHRKIAVQTWSMHKMTLVQTLERIKSLDIDGVELFPGQKLGGKYPDAKVGPSLNPEQIAYLKKILKDAGVKPVSFGVTGGGSEKNIEAICKFAKEMGITRVLTEDPVASWQIWDRIGKKYGVTMCVHHHSMTSPNQYWEPMVLAKYTSGYDNVKANPDIGHWSLCAIDPVEGLKTLRGKYASLHFKDQKEFGVPKNQCVVLGTGAFDMKAILSELDSQGFDGFLTLENENIASDPMPVIKACVEYLRKN